MNQSNVQSVADVFKMASDPTRLRVLLILRDDERHVGDLCNKLSQSQPAVSHHLCLLKLSGLIRPERRSKHNFYSITDKGHSLVAAYDAIAA